MADEAQYTSGTDLTTSKRKYEDQTTTPPSSGGRRTTGFSAPISSQSPDAAPPSYNNVPPPVDEIQLAKQKAQEIAARLFNSADAKRPRVENGSGFDSSDVKGFGSDLGQKPMVSSFVPSMSGSYGYGQSKKIEIPNGRVGVIIGKGGETIKYLQLQSGAKIQVTRDMDADPNSATRGVELMGTPDQIAKAEQLINEVLAEAEAGGSGVVNRRVAGQQGGSDQFVMKVPNNKVGLIIGKGGETIKNMQARTGARIQVIPLHLPPGDTSTERTVQVDGSSEQIEAAKQLINEVISENRLRNSAMTGSYPQQGYQARPPSSWAPSGPPMQQAGYGYSQPGAYPGQSAQYNMSQQPYPGYGQPTSGGYGTGWDQTTQQNQQTPGGAYDYYSQQPSQQQQAPGGPPADNSAYGYNQPPASGYGQQGQGYSQDGYGGYHAPAPPSGYGPPQSNPMSGYDQQQGYSATAGAYGNVSNPTPEGHNPSYGTQGDNSQAPPPVQSSAMGQPGYNAGQQPSPMGQPGYSAGQQPSPNPSYPPQGSTQQGYGVPPTSQSGYGALPSSGYGSNYGPPQAQKPPSSQPAAYGQSPSAQGGYPQSAAVQPGYSHSQSAPTQSSYAQQPDSGGQRAPSNYSLSAGQAGYGAPPYGTPPATQPGYGQQGPPYNSSYGSGYSQAPVYSADGNARGTYDATTAAAATGAPASQSAQPTTAVAKTSPQS